MSFHQLSKEDYEKVHGIMTTLIGHETRNHPAEVITTLYSVHNMCFPNNPEYSKSCGGCRTRVYNRMVSYYNETKHLYGY